MDGFIFVKFCKQRKDILSDISIYLCNMSARAQKSQPSLTASYLDNQHNLWHNVRQERRISDLRSKKDWAVKDAHAHLTWRNESHRLLTRMLYVYEFDLRSGVTIDLIDKH